MFLDIIKTVTKGKILKQVTENFLSPTLPNTITTAGTTVEITAQKKLKVESTETVGTREAVVKTFGFDLPEQKVVVFTIEGFRGSANDIAYYLSLEKQGVSNHKIQLNDNIFTVQNNGATVLTKPLNYSLTGTNVGTRKKNISFVFGTIEKIVYIMEDDQIVAKEDISALTFDLTGIWNFKVNVYDSTKTKTTWLEIAQLKVELHS